MWVCVNRDVSSTKKGTSDLSRNDFQMGSQKDKPQHILPLPLSLSRLQLVGGRKIFIIFDSYDSTG